ncbi:2-dehydropantoate 2-reductase N-terminal domain-containing protein [Leuconostoc sp. DB-1]|uniref:2-dehydropantoate 2-reductase N-terminal domain-containing protein n=1 Tax=Leuconostoc sp. DB-1 TaxID=2724526 RepID=UPI0027B98089|nr:2-dehydropantoate 2-reductase N-terminal domain-containing protein [Leuconostoc sp. DB-1]
MRLAISGIVNKYLIAHASKIMKIAIAGFGALGARVGVMLQQAGHEVTGIDGWAAHIAAISTDGLTVHQDDGATKNIIFLL